MTFSPISISLSDDLQISADLFAPLDPEVFGRSLIILCHGFSGFRRNAFFPTIADAFRNEGYTVLSIDFTGNGVDPETGDVVDEERFSTNTFTREEQDLRELIDVLRFQGISNGSESVVPEELFLFGHSRGGAAVMILSAEAKYKDLLKGVAVWGSPSDLAPERFGLTPEIAVEWRKTGVIPYKSSRLGRDLPLKLVVLEDMERDPNRIEKAIRKTLCPILAVHGEVDQSVSTDCAKQIASWSDKASYSIVPKASHSFGAEKGGEGFAPELREAFDLTLRFFQESSK